MGPCISTHGLSGFGFISSCSWLLDGPCDSALDAIALDAIAEAKFDTTFDTHFLCGVR